jgi:hypothetical protein
MSDNEAFGNADWNDNHGLHPNFLVYPDSKWNGFPSWVTLFMKIMVRANQWPWVVVTAAIVFAEIVHMRFQKPTWALATALGGLAGSLVIRAMR